MRQLLIYTCPLCESILATYLGDQVNKANGITLYCKNKQCPAQEVMGHGKNEMEAYKVVLEKFESREQKEVDKTK